MRYLAALACVVGLVSSAAFAQSSFVTNSVQQTLNINDPLNHAYQQTSSTSCSLAGTCELSFPAVPHKVLLLHVSCFFIEQGGHTPPTQAAVLISGPAGTSTQNQLQVFYSGPNTNVSGDYNFGINSDAYLIYAKGDQPVVALITSSVSVVNLSCTLSGYHN
jgi:hypothetical protein